MSGGTFQYSLSVIEKLGLPLQSELHLTDESGTEVDADVFEELLQAGNLTVKVSTGQSSGKIQMENQGPIPTEFLLRLPCNIVWRAESMFFFFFH